MATLYITNLNTALADLNTALELTPNIDTLVIADGVAADFKTPANIHIIYAELERKCNEHGIIITIEAPKPPTKLSPRDEARRNLYLLIQSHMKRLEDAFEDAFTPLFPPLYVLYLPTKIIPKLTAKPTFISLSLEQARTQKADLNQAAPDNTASYRIDCYEWNFSLALYIFKETVE